MATRGEKENECRGNSAKGPDSTMISSTFPKEDIGCLVTRQSKCEVGVDFHGQQATLAQKANAGRRFSNIAVLAVMDSINTCMLGWFVSLILI